MPLADNDPTTLEPVTPLVALRKAPDDLLPEIVVNGEPIPWWVWALAGFTTAAIFFSQE